MKTKVALLVLIVSSNLLGGPVYSKTASGAKPPTFVEELERSLRRNSVGALAEDHRYTSFLKGVVIGAVGGSAVSWALILVCRAYRRT